MKKAIFSLCLFLLLIYVVIGFLTFHALKNAEKTAQYNQLQQKVRDSEKIMQLIEKQLQQTQEKLFAITQFLDTSKADNLTRLIDNTPIIQSIFLINNRQLIYPVFTEQPTAAEQQFRRLITPFVNDPSLLLQHGKTVEGSKQLSGWYNVLTAHSPTLIYWQQSDKSVLGYVLSYTVFRAHLIANADNIQVTGQYEVLDNGQLLLSNRTQRTQPVLPNHLTDNNLIKVIRSPDYPLQHWTVNYVLPPTHVNYWPMILLAVVLAVMLTLITLIIYYYMQRHVRLAARQVQFVGQVSHELKTPLTNIRLYADLLSEQTGIDKQAKHYLTVIIDEAQRLTRLIQNVLNFTKSPTARIEPISVDALLNRLIQTFSPALQTKNLTIQLKNQCPADTFINSDQDMLMQILANFISNAEKYAADGKYIDIEANKDKKQCIISIRDYGKGIAKNEIKQILKPFYRVHNHLTEGVAGTGIGLTIAKQLADILGIALKIEQTTPGMRFSLVLQEPEQKIRQ